MKKIIYFIFLIFIGYSRVLLSQEKSNQIETINGKTYYIHSVKKGESLYGISKTYGVDIEAIYNENPSVKNNGLKAGQKILIPLKKTETEKKESVTNVPSTSNISLDTLHFKYHKVVKGQTIYSICKMYAITQEYFFELNPDKKLGIKENDFVIVGKKENTIPPHLNIQEIKSAISEEITSFKPQYLKKTKYNVLLILPFNASKVDEWLIEDFVKNQQAFPSMSSMMIDFFQGILYAADSLKSDSFQVNITPLDITEQDSLKFVQCLSTQEYKQADIVIGPVYSSLIKTEQSLNKETKLHIIPFISLNKFLFNHPEYSKTTPSVYVDLQALAQFVFDSLRTTTSKVFLLYSNSNGDKDYSKEFKQYYDQLILKHNLKDTIQSIRSISDLKRNIKEKERYTVVFLTNNQVLATDYITQLSIINKTSPIRLCGFFKNIQFDNLDLEYFNQMNFTFAYYQNLNYKSLFPTFLLKYKDTLKTDPSTFFYEGLQIGLYYFNILKTQGLSGFYELDKYPLKDSNIFMPFQFYRPDESTGFQNNGEYIFTIYDRKIQRVR